jgi:hypothetical protein
MLIFFKMKKALLITTLLVAAATLPLSPAALAFDGDGHMRGGGHMREVQHMRAGEGAGDTSAQSPHPERPHNRRAIKRGVTPYGDFCPTCTLYGVGRKPVGHGKAVSAMRAYFAKKGCTIGNVRGVGRFMKVNVYRRGVLIDRVIFDRRTGRIRSIY